MSSQNQSEQPAQPETFKQQLDRVAVERRGSPQDNQQQTNPIVEKITEYIPAAASLLGTNKQDEDKSTEQKEVPGPPERPDHDHKIEDFVRDQHRSLTDGGALNTGR